MVYGQAGHTAINLSDVALGLGGLRIVGEAAGDLGNMVVLGGQDLNRDGVADLVIGAPGSGERVQVLFTPANWQPDANIYGTGGGDLMGPGYGGFLHSIGA